MTEQAVNLETQTYRDFPRRHRQPTESVGGKIFQKIPLIMAEVGHVAKARKNTQQGYSFRGVDDVYQAVQAILAKHGVFSSPYVEDERTEERTTKNGSALIYRVLTIRHRFYAEDGSYFDARVIGEGMDSGDKASNKAMSVADKYSLLEVFKIPTEESKDPEDESHDVAPRGAPQQAAPKAAPKKPLPPPPKDPVAVAMGARAAAEAAGHAATRPYQDIDEKFYDNTNADRRGRLLAILRTMKEVPADKHEAIAKRLHRRLATDLKVVIDEIIKGPGSSSVEVPV